MKVHKRSDIHYLVSSQKLMKAVIELNIDLSNIVDEMALIHKMQTEGHINNPEVFKFRDYNNITESELYYLISYSTPKFFVKDDYCYLRQLYVVPEKRRSGIATKVVCDLEILCKENGWNAIELESEDESIAFFVKMGYKLTGERLNRMRKTF